MYNGIISFAIGFTGGGKSFDAKKVKIPEFTKNVAKRVFVIDPKGDFKKDLPPGIKFKEFTHHNMNELIPFLKEHKYKDFYAIYSATIHTPNRIVQHDAHNIAMGIAMMQVPYMKTFGKIGQPVLLVVDELKTVYPLNCSKDFYGIGKIAGQGRGMGISLHGLAQGYKQAGSDFSQNVTEIDLFGIEFEEDIKNLGNRFVTEKENGKDIIKRLMNSPKYSKIRYKLIDGRKDVKLFDPMGKEIPPPTST